MNIFSKVISFCFVFHFKEKALAAMSRMSKNATGQEPSDVVNTLSILIGKYINIY